MFKTLEEFCNDHNIQWSYRFETHVGWKFEFYHGPSDTEYTTRFSISETVHPVLLNSKLIRRLFLVFDLGGDKEMFDGCSINVNSYYPGTVDYCRKDVESTMAIYGYWRQNRIKDVIFNDPATIVIWADGTKTVVKANREKFDPEKGLAMAIAKKFFGNQGNYYEVFKKWLPEEKEEESLYPNITIPKLNINVKGLKKQLTGIKNRLRNLTTDDIPRYLTAAELAEKIGLTVETVRKDCRAGLHPGAVKVDGKWMIPYEE